MRCGKDTNNQADHAASWALCLGEVRLLITSNLIRGRVSSLFLSSASYGALQQAHKQAARPRGFLGSLFGGGEVLGARLQFFCSVLESHGLKHFYERGECEPEYSSGSFEA